MSWKPTSIAALVLLCALLPAVAGCGGAKTSSPPSSTAASTSSGRSKAECLRLARAAANAQEQLSQGLAGTIFKADPLADRPAFHGDDISVDAQAFAVVAARAPAPIRGSYATLTAAFRRLGEALQGVNLRVGELPDSTARARLRTFAGRTDRTRLSSAETAIATWIATSCHYD